MYVRKKIIYLILPIFLLSIMFAPASHSNITGAGSANDFIFGDANGDGVVNVTDAIIVLRQVVNLVDIEVEYGALALLMADVDGNGSVNVSDVIQILRHVVSLIDEFPMDSAIVHIDDLNFDIELEKGTAAADAIALLINEVYAVLNNKTELYLTINWVADENYDASVAGDYVFEGTIDVPVSAIYCPSISAIVGFSLDVEAKLTVLATIDELNDDLSILIDEDQAIIDGLDEEDIGDDVGQYSQDAVDALEAAIADAQKVLDDEEATYQEVVDAIATLEAAKAAFEASVITADFTALEAKIAEAEALLADSEEGTEVGQYPPSAFADLEAAIADVKAVEGNDQAEVDAAVDALNTAINTFKASVISGDVLTAEDLGVIVDDILPGVLNVTIPFATASELLGATEDSVLLLAIDGKAHIELAYNANINAFFQAAVQSYTEWEIRTAPVSLSEDALTASDLGVEIEEVLPGVFNLSIDFAVASAELGATTSSVLVLNVAGKDNIELNYNATLDAFFKAAVQHYTELEIENATVSLK